MIEAFKINEEEIKFMEYLKFCFINLYDEGYLFKKCIQDNTFGYDYYPPTISFEMLIEIPKLNKSNSSSLVDFGTFILEKAIEIESGIEKIVLEYPEINFINNIIENYNKDKLLKVKFKF